MVGSKKSKKKEIFFFLLFFIWEKATRYWEKRWLFLIGNGAEIQPLEMGRKSPESSFHTRKKSYLGENRAPSPHGAVDM